MIEQIKRLMSSIGYDECFAPANLNDLYNSNCCIEFRKSIAGMYAVIDIHKGFISNEWKIGSYIEMDRDDFTLRSNQLTETEIRTVLKVIDILKENKTW